MPPPHLKSNMYSDTDRFLKKQCRYCESRLREPFLSLGTMALANSFLTAKELEKPEFTCPLKLALCPTCHLVQLTHVVPPERMFSHYLYVSSTTKTFQTHFANYAKTVKGLCQSKRRLVAVDIGSNDGLLLGCYRTEGLEPVGVEPAKNLSDQANVKNQFTINRYFDDNAVQEIIDRFGKVDAISGNNVFAHMDDIPGVLERVKKVLQPDGFFVIEFPYLVKMFDEMLFDMIYHEHLSYISVIALNFVLKRHELEIFRIDPVSTHGGSLRVFIQKAGSWHSVSDSVKSYLDSEMSVGYDSDAVYRSFADRVHGVKKSLAQYVKDIKKSDKSIAGYGAPAKGNTLINFCELGPNEIEFIVDDNPLKQGTYTPGSRIKVVSSTHLTQNPTDYILIFAWNFADEIIANMSSLKEKGATFIVPLPEPMIV